MKKILCYGDSNTFGYNPVNTSRFDENTRWTALLQKSLGSEYQVTEEGMCGRTGFVDNENGFIFSAQKHFPEKIAKLGDVDLIILAIGTNDLQSRYDLSFSDVEIGLKNLILVAKNYAKKIVLIPSVVLSESVLSGSFGDQFDETSISKSKEMGKFYEKYSKMYELNLFDFNEFIKPSAFDGLHYDETGHKVIAQKLAQYLLTLQI